MRITLLALALALGLGLAPAPVAEARLSDYDQHGVCLTAKSLGKFADDPAVFDGFTVKGVNNNGHWHFDWIPVEQRPTVGQCFIGSFQRTQDAKGEHYQAFKVMITSVENAMQAGGESCPGTMNCGYSTDIAVFDFGQDD